MRLALVGEVRSAEFALRGMLDAGHPPACIITTDVRAVQRTSGMSPDYYADLVPLGAERGIDTVVVADAKAIAGPLEEAAPDFAFVIGWPYLVREPLLSRVPCIGMHPSRLPYRRGGAPLNWAILDGERESAVSLLRLRDGVDDGELLAQRTFDIADDEYVGDVLARVLDMTMRLVAESVDALAAGTARWCPQDHTAATYTRRRRPEDGRIGWSDSAVRIRNLVRAVSVPFPGAFTVLDGRLLRVWRAEVPRGVRAPLRAAPGTILDCGPGGVLVSTRDNALLVTAASFDGAETLAGPALSAALAPFVGRPFA